MTASSTPPSGAADPIDRPTTRRDRQLREIATLVASGDRHRAAGLALEHIAAFPDDAALVARMDA